MSLYFCPVECSDHVSLPHPPFRFPPADFPFMCPPLSVPSLRTHMSGRFPPWPLRPPLSVPSVPREPPPHTPRLRLCGFVAHKKCYETLDHVFVNRRHLHCEFELFMITIAIAMRSIPSLSGGRAKLKSTELAPKKICAVRLL
jgi:hypothetical protein